jgi:peptidoglycan hydrolase-like protein with peptidoglycan-binding domain
VVYDEAKHKRGTGSQGGQFVSAGGAKSSSLGYDGKRGAGYGDKGGDANVKALQKELNRLGAVDAQGKQLTVDGKFGPKTTAALQRLQRKLGMKPDGKITPALLSKLKGLKPSAHDKHTMHERHLKATGKKAAPAKKATPAKRAPAKKPTPAAKKTAPAKKAAPSRHEQHAAHAAHQAHAAHVRHTKRKRS